MAISSDFHSCIITPVGVVFVDAVFVGAVFEDAVVEVGDRHAPVSKTTIHGPDCLESIEPLL